jgi:hypothetical protein
VERILNSVQEACSKLSRSRLRTFTHFFN